MTLRLVGALPRRAASRAAGTARNNSAIRMPMIVITTNIQGKTPAEIAAPCEGPIRYHHRSPFNKRQLSAHNKRAPF